MVHGRVHSRNGLLNSAIGAAKVKVRCNRPAHLGKQAAHAALGLLEEATDVMTSSREQRRRFSPEAHHALPVPLKTR